MSNTAQQKNRGAAVASVAGASRLEEGLRVVDTAEDGRILVCFQIGVRHNCRVRSGQ